MTSIIRKYVMIAGLIVLALAITISLFVTIRLVNPQLRQIEVALQGAGVRLENMELGLQGVKKNVDVLDEASKTDASAITKLTEQTNGIANAVNAQAALLTEHTARLDTAEKKLDILSGRIVGTAEKIGEITKKSEETDKILADLKKSREEVKKAEASRSQQQQSDDALIAAANEALKKLNLQNGKPPAVVLAPVVPTTPVTPTQSQVKQGVAASTGATAAASQQVPRAYHAGAIGKEKYTRAQVESGKVRLSSTDVVTLVYFPTGVFRRDVLEFPAVLTYWPEGATYVRYHSKSDFTVYEDADLYLVK